MTTVSTPPGRSWYSFSLRTMFVVTTLIGIWLAVVARSANQQRRAVDQIVAAGGRVTYSYQYDGAGKFDKNAEPPGPSWLRQAIGDHFFVTADRVAFAKGSFTYYNVDDGTVLTSIDRKPVSDAALAALKNLPHVAKVDLQLADFSDECLPRVTCLKSLRFLYLNGTRITDQGLKQLESLTALRQLDLRETDITPDAAQRLSKALPKTQIIAEQTPRGTPPR